MNRVNYLFDACVSHHNTLRIQRELDEFFEEQETKFFNEYADKEFATVEELDEELTHPRTTLDNWADVYKYTSTEWRKHNYERDVDVSLKPRIIHYDGYLYRWMSINEYNKYITHTLEDNERDWSATNGCSDNIGYCFIGEDYGYLNEWELNLESEYLSYADKKNEIEYQLSHVGMINTNYMKIPGGNIFHPRVRTMDVFCKFRYKGDIRQCISYYGEGFFDEWEDNYMIEYGLKNYNNLELVDARFAVYDTRLSGSSSYEKDFFFELV